MLFNKGSNLTFKKDFIPWWVYSWRLQNEKDNNKSVRSGLISTKILGHTRWYQYEYRNFSCAFFSTPNDFQFPFSVLQKRKADKETEFAKRSLGLF